MIGTVASALWSHWRRQPLQLATLLIGLALATGLWSAVQAINAEARANYARAAQQMGAGQGDVLTHPSGAMPLDTYVTLRRAGWQVSPVLEGRARLGGIYVTLLGVDLLSYPLLPPSPSDGDLDLSPLALFSAPGRLFASAETLARLTPTDALPPLVETPDLPPGVVLTDIGVAERLLHRPGQLTRLMVLPDQPLGLQPLATLVPELRRLTPDPVADTAQMTDSFHLNLTAFGLLSFVVGLFIVHGAIGLAFQQRRSMFRTLRALGVPARTLTRLVLAEVLILALLAGAAGLVLGYLVAAALLPDVAATLRGLYGAPVTGGLTLRPVWFASGLGMSVMGAVLASAQGLYQLRRLPLLAAPGVRAWGAASARMARGMALAGLMLLAMGGAAVWMFDGLIAGFALLGGLLLGAALLLPPILHLILGVIARHSTPGLAQWIWADMRAQVPGLSLALMALMLALATNIGVSTMVSSFRLTFTGWLDHRLASEIYVTARDDVQGAALAAWLEPRVAAVLPLRAADSRIADAPGRIYGIVDHDTYRQNWPLIAANDQVWDALARGEAALINEQLARRANLWPGDLVTLAPGWTLPVGGVYSDYGNPSGQGITALPALLERFPDSPNRQFGLRLPPGDVAALVAELRAEFDLPVSGIVRQGEIKALSLRIFETTFVITGALNLLTLGVASFAILTSLLTLWSARLPQIAPVWAMGLTRARLARLELYRSLGLAALTAALALPLGLVLAWVLLAVINVEAFGWRLPMYLFPRDWLVLGALALLAAALAAAWPARRLTRVPPGALLKVFANER